MPYEPVIGLEVHAELLTQSKMFCGCAVVDNTSAEPNRFVCPICAGMPGTLPVINEKAVEYALRVALALECTVAPVNVFARKNYFYPDLPKGYQISQYELPLAQNGRLVIETGGGEKTIGIRRVHLEEDTGKLFHVETADGGRQTADMRQQTADGRRQTGAGGQRSAVSGRSYSLVDLNRAGVPLLEIVAEPDLRSVEELKAFATGLRTVLRYLGVNSGDMEKGVLRFEANISVRPQGSSALGTRTEIKNVNSFRGLVRAVEYEIHRQSALLGAGGRVIQETVGWDETAGATVSQRGKEEAHDYRYFPEPDLPPLVIEPEWIERVRAELPELPAAKRARFERDYGLSPYDSSVLVAERAVADYFEAAMEAGGDLPPRQIANWLSGSLFGLMNQSGREIGEIAVSPAELAELVRLVVSGQINANTGKAVLAEMFETGNSASEIVAAQGLALVSDEPEIARRVAEVLASNPDQVQLYMQGKATLVQWFVGQVMRAMRGKADPQVVKRLVDEQLAAKSLGAGVSNRGGH